MPPLGEPPGPHPPNGQPPHGRPPHGRPPEREWLHDPAREDERLDGLVAAAFGEPVDLATVRHHDSCPRCAVDRERLVRTVQLAREPVDALPVADAEPPASVWAGIAAQLGIDPAAPAEPVAGPASTLAGPASPSVLARRRVVRVRRRVAVGLVAAAILAAAAVGGYGLGRSRSATVATCPAGSAELAHLPDGPTGVAGQAVLACTADGPALRVSTSRLPVTDGFYEVWLYNPVSGDMVAVGTLSARGTGSFTLPAGIDLAAFHVVDVSAQQYNGSPAHDRSVLRGPLTS